MENTKNLKEKLGRKKLTDEERKDAFVQFKVTALEKENLLVLAAKTHHRDLSSFLRELIFKNVAKIKYIPPINHRAKDELGKQGINLNQIAKQLNSTYQRSDLDEVTKKLTEIHENLILIYRKITDLEDTQ